jgi:hypothetical protein
MMVPVAALADPGANDVMAAILLRALAYDRQFKARVGDAVTVGVVFLPSDAGSQAAKGEIVSALNAWATRKLDGLPIGVVALPFVDVVGLGAAVRQGIDFLFVTRGLGAKLEDIQKVSRAARIPTLAYERDFVERGLAVAVIVVSGKPKLVINLAGSRSEGMDMPATVLQLAEVIK